MDLQVFHQKWKILPLKHFFQSVFFVLKRLQYLLTSFSIFHALIIAIEELSIEQLYSYDSKNEVEKKIDNENVEDILEWVDDTVEHSLQFRNSFDGLQWPEHAQNTQGFNNTKIFSCGTSTKMKIHLNLMQWEILLI